MTRQNSPITQIFKLSYVVQSSTGLVVRWQSEYQNKKYISQAMTVILDQKSGIQILFSLILTWDPNTGLSPVFRSWLALYYNICFQQYHFWDVWYLDLDCTQIKTIFNYRILYCSEIFLYKTSETILSHGNLNTTKGEKERISQNNLNQIGFDLNQSMYANP